MNRDIDDGDGTGELANAKDRESLDQNVETAAHVRAATPGKESGNETRQGEHRRTTDACNDNCRTAVV